MPYSCTWFLCLTSQGATASPAQLTYITWKCSFLHELFLMVFVVQLFNIPSPYLLMGGLHIIFSGIALQDQAMRLIYVANVMLLCSLCSFSGLFTLFKSHSYHLRSHIQLVQWLSGRALSWHTQDIGFSPWHCKKKKC